MKTASSLLLIAALAIVPTLSVSHAADAPAPAPAAPAAPVDPAENARRVAELPALETYLNQMVDMRKSLSGDVVDPKGFRHSAVNDLNDAIRNMRDMIAEYKGDEPAKK